MGHRLLLEALAEYDLRLAHFAVLAALADFGPLAQHELADRLDINRSHLVGYVDHVEQRGLVARDGDPDDRRRRRVALTAAGRALLRDLEPVAPRGDSYRSAFLVREHARPAPRRLRLIQAEGLARAARSIVR